MTTTRSRVRSCPPAPIQRVRTRRAPTLSIWAGCSAAPTRGGFDLGSMMEMAANVQQQVAEAQDRLVAARLEGTAGGGLVSVTLNGHLHLVGLHIDPAAGDPDDPSMLEDLVRAAWQDAYEQVARLQAAADPLGGMGGGGGLGSLFGGG